MSPRVVTLVDPASRATARVLPEVGMNCFSFCPVLDGQIVETLWAAPGFDSGTLRSTASGIPILFPFAGRLRGTHLRFGDREVPLVIDERQHCAIHGFVHNRPWRVIDEQPASGAGSFPEATPRLLTAREMRRRPKSVTAEFHAAWDDPALLKLWPADFRIRVTYEVAANELHCRIRVDNPDDHPLPFSLGAHDYFRVPVASEEACRVFVPARSYWELSSMLPTGQKLPADGPRGLAAGMSLSQIHLDDVLTDLETHGGRVACRIEDPVNRRRLTLEFDEVFRECVVFNPPHREAIALEPYTNPPDYFALAEQGVGGGPQVLQPGESFEAQITIRVESTSELK